MRTLKVFAGWCFGHLLLTCRLYVEAAADRVIRRSTASSESLRQRTLDNLLEHYDPRIPPNYEEDIPVTVFVQIHITNIDSISETDMDYSIGMFIRQSWHDSRLIYTKLPKLRSLELDSRLMSDVWVPDLFIANEKSAYFHSVTVPNKLMHIYPDGRVQYSIRVSATVQCNMDLRKYPLDSQTCSMIMESYGYSTETLMFKWNAMPLTIQSTVRLAQFHLGQKRTFQCDKQYYGVNYTCIMLEFDLSRSFGYYLTQVYVPSILIVVLSWVSFWLDIDAVPARISLGLLTVLTMTTQSAGARASLPKVSYVKGIDVWMAVCLLFVFAALIEFAYVNVHARIEKRRRQSCKPTACDIQNGKKAESQDTADVKPSRFNMFAPSRQKARTCDRISRIAFPGVFVAFNAVYWCVYILWSPGELLL